ncbi:MAG: STAS domain-containing protein [Planctomycetota bacterium]|nr:STAS domain-containing protein [Planctomycetota bacterium]
MAEATHVITEPKDGALIARITTPTLSEYEAGVVGKEIENEAVKHGWKVALDFTRVEFMASAGIGMIVSILNQSRNQGGKVVVFGMREELLKVIRMTKLDKLFAIEKNEAGAMKKLK